MADIKLLDCTLRDGGYVNNWQWGFGSARRIIQTLTRAGVDVVEVGFLRNVDGYDPDVTVCNTIEELNRLLPDEGQRGHTMYSGMAMRSNYDIAKLSPYDGHGIEIIRITAHDYGWHGLCPPHQRIGLQGLHQPHQHHGLQRQGPALDL